MCIKSRTLTGGLQTTTKQGFSPKPIQPKKTYLNNPITYGLPIRLNINIFTI